MPVTVSFVTSIFLWNSSASQLCHFLTVSGEPILPPDYDDKAEINYEDNLPRVAENGLSNM